ncbi:MAG TPA: radical SAM protein [Candidatus Atribacteria bacterium]|nr:radical SAM protein [Candidatus Atribacteria bacterium]
MKGGLSMHINKLKQAVNIGRHFIGVDPMYPLKLEMLLTYKCDSRCYFCERWKEKTTLPLKYVLEAIKDFSDLGGLAVNFLGGEPLLYQNLSEVLKYSKENVALNKVSLSTNGVRLHPILKRSHISDYLDKIYVSLDTLNSEKYKTIRGIDALDRVLKGIRSAKEDNIDVQVNITITNDNLDELEDILEYATKEEIKVGLQPVHTLKGGAFVSPSEISIEALKRALNKILRYKNIINQPELYLKMMPFYLEDPERFFKNNNIRCFAGSLLVTIDPHGGVYPCDAKFIKIGNIMENSLKSIWKSKRRLKIVEQIKNGKHPKCWLDCIAPLNLEMKKSLKDIIVEGIRRYG